MLGLYEGLTALNFHKLEFFQNLTDLLGIMFITMKPALLYT
jgi:hypothetical protein